MTLSDSLLKSFAAATNDSSDAGMFRLVYGHAILYNDNVYVIIDSEISTERINTLTTSTNLEIDEHGLGVPELTIDSNNNRIYYVTNELTFEKKEIHFTESSNSTLIGGDLYLDLNTNDLYISEFESYTTLENKKTTEKKYLVWNRACTITSAIPTVGVNNGDRVTLTVKNHQVLITGNLTNPGSVGTGSSTSAVEWETVNIDFSTFI